MERRKTKKVSKETERGKGEEVHWRQKREAQDTEGVHEQRERRTENRVTEKGEEEGTRRRERRKTKEVSKETERGIGDRATGTCRA